MKIFHTLALFFSFYFCPVAHSHGALNASFIQAIYTTATKHFSNQQYLMSASQFSLITDIEKPLLLRDRARYAYALSLWKLGDPMALELQLDRTTSIRNKEIYEAFLLFKAYLRPNLTHSLSDDSTLRLDIWKTRLAAKLPSSNANVETLTNSLKIRSILSQYQDRPKKYPALAGFLSLVPGLGQAYSGAFQAAAVAFAINLIFGLATQELYQKNMPAVGAASALVFSVTYFGNIISAYQGAEQFNLSRRQIIDEKLRHELFHFSPYP